MLQRKPKNKLERPKRLLSNWKVELGGECRHQLPVAKQRSEKSQQQRQVLRLQLIQVPQQAPLILVLLQAQGLGIPHARQWQQHTLAQVRTIQLLTPIYAVCYQEDQLESNGLEWVQCVCGRWLHEECICDIDVDDWGRELFCPFCAVECYYCV